MGMKRGKKREIRCRMTRHDRLERDKQQKKRRGREQQGQTTGPLSLRPEEGGDREMGTADGYVGRLRTLYGAAVGRSLGKSREWTGVVGGNCVDVHLI